MFKKKEDLAVNYVKECSSYVFLCFIVSCLTFRSLIHFEFIFVYGVRECSNFILLHVAVQFSQHHLLKRLFSIVYPCLLCHRLVDWVIYFILLSSLQSCEMGKTRDLILLLNVRKLSLRKMSQKWQSQSWKLSTPKSDAFRYSTDQQKKGQ